MEKKVKICFAASSGGHLEELSCLKELADKYDSFLLTEKSGFDSGKKAWKKVYYVSQINRKEKQFMIKYLMNCLSSVKILWKERPNYIISTGALATFPICYLGKKIFKCKIVYIESFARVDNRSLTGKYMENVADLFLVQWPDMIKFYPKAEYYGGLF